MQINPRGTVLVVGGAGFIGRELIRQLIASGYSVRAMVRRSGVALEDFRADGLEVVPGVRRSGACRTS